MHNTSTSAVTPPWSKDDLRQAVVDLFLLHLRTTSLWTSPGHRLYIEGIVPEDHEWWNPELSVDALGLAYPQVAGSTFAQVMEYQYDYAFLGVEGLEYEPLDMGTTHTWIGAYLSDLDHGYVLDEWESHGVQVDHRAAIQRCMEVAELANARRTMETGEPFFYFDGAQSRGGKGESATAVGGLTVRQVALLAGMEEMTIRAAISRKSAGVLVPHKEEGRTLFKPEVVKQWLQSKGRYLAITHGRAGDELNLAKIEFKSVLALQRAISLRVDQMDHDAPAGTRPVRRAVEALVPGAGQLGAPVLTPAVLRDAARMAQLAQLLQLPSKLFVLRVQQAALNEELQATDRQLRVLVNANPA